MQVWLFNRMTWPFSGARWQFPFPRGDYDRQVGGRLYLEHLKLYVAADDGGFDGVCLTEHHYRAYGLCPSPNVMAAALARETRRAKIVLMGNCLPCHAPVRLAEELAMVDILSEGRLVAGFIRGAPSEYQAYNVPYAESRSRFEEAWELIVRAWTSSEAFSWEGRHFQYDVVSILPLPVQVPHPPVIMAGRSVDSLRWAARHVTPVADNLLPVSEVRKTFDHYDHCARDEFGWRAGPPQHVWSCLVHAAPTTALAREQAEEHVLRFFAESPGAKHLLARRHEMEPLDVAGRDALLSAGRGGGTAADGDLSLDDLEDLGLCVLGSPDRVAAELQRHIQRLGCGVLLIETPFSTLPLPCAASSLALLAQHVLPALKRSVAW